MLIIRGLIILRKLKEIWSWLRALYNSLLARIEWMSFYNILSEISSLLKKMSAADWKFVWGISVFLSNISKRSACDSRKKAFLNMFTLLINLKAVEPTLHFIQRGGTDKSLFFLPLTHCLSDYIMLLTYTW